MEESIETTRREEDGGSRWLREGEDIVAHLDKLHCGEVAPESFLSRRQISRPCLSPKAPEGLHLVPRSPIPPEDLPAMRSRVPPGSNPLSVSHLDQDKPLDIHNHSVEGYQKIYHDVVDSMMTKAGKFYPYSMALGQTIKRKLWERLNRPTFLTLIREDGRVIITKSYRFGGRPPRFKVDTSREPKP